MQTNYPHWICHECGIKGVTQDKIKLKEPFVACYHVDRCEVCNKVTIVTEARDYGYPSFTKKPQITKITTKLPCYCCTEGLHGKARPRKGCKACGGTGKYDEYHYIISDGKNAVDCDTLK